MQGTLTDRRCFENEGMKKLFWIFIFVFGMLYPVLAVVDQEASMRGKLNDTSLPFRDRLVIFAELVKKYGDEQADFNTLFARFVEDEKLLTPVEKMKMELAFAFERSNKEAILTKANEILAIDNASAEDRIVSYFTLARHYKRTGYYNYALENMMSALRIDEQILSEISGHDLYSFWANLYIDQKKYQRSIPYFKKSIAEGLKRGEPLKPYQEMNNMALAFHYMGENDSALLYYDQVRNYLSQELPDTLQSGFTDFFLSLITGNIGDVYLEKGEYEQAEPLLLYDVEHSKLAGELENTSISQLNLSEVYLETKRYRDAKAVIDEAYATILSNNFRSRKRTAFDRYAKYYEYTGDYAKSVEFYGKYIALNDSITDEIISRKIIDLELEFDLLNAAKELELARVNAEKSASDLSARQNQLLFTLGFVLLLLIVLGIIYSNNRSKSRLNTALNAKNSEVKQRGKELEKALHEKNLMLKEIHHRVKNNLQMISSLLRLQAIEINDDKVSLAIEESINRLKSMSLIHQKLYLDDDFKKIRLRTYYENLIEQIAGSFIAEDTEVVCNVDIEDINLSVDSAVPIGLIANEIINNSYKHAFVNQDTGVISSTIRRNDSQVTLMIRDNGVGLPDQFQINNQSFGSTLINLLVEQLGGKLKFYNDNGAVFQIDFDDFI